MKPAALTALANVAAALAGENKTAPYVALISTGSSIDLATMKIGATVWAEVRHEDGALCWTSQSHWRAKMTPRQRQGLLLSARQMAARYAADLEQTGKRFEVVERERREAAALESKRVKRLAWLRENVPKLVTELTEAENEQSRRDAAAAVDGSQHSSTERGGS